MIAAGKKDLAAAWNSSTDAATLKEVSSNLRARAKAPYSDADAAILSKWADLFADLAAAVSSGNTKRIDTARKALSELKTRGGQLSDGEVIEDATSGTFVPSQYARSVHAAEPVDAEEVETVVPCVGGCA